MPRLPQSTLTRLSLPIQRLFSYLVISWHSLSDLRAALKVDFTAQLIAYPAFPIVDTWDGPCLPRPRSNHLQVLFRGRSIEF